MAKRKPSSLQRRRDVIEAVKYLKAKGFISKQTKLNGGKYVSRKAVERVRQFQGELASGYTTQKVSKEIAQKAKSQGFLVTLGNRVVVPAEDYAFRKRLREGYVSGVVPVRGGHMTAVVLPHDIMDMRSLVRKLQDNPRALDDLKLPGELFAFRLYGNMSYRPFRDTDDFLKYLLNYRSIFDSAGDLRAEHMDEIFQNLQLLKMDANNVGELIPSRDARERARKARGRNYDRDNERRRIARQERLQKMFPARLDRQRKRNATSEAKRREGMNEQEREAYNRKGAERAKRSRDARKPS